MYSPFIEVSIIGAFVERSIVVIGVVYANANGVPTLIVESKLTTVELGLKNQEALLRNQDHMVQSHDLTLREHLAQQGLHVTSVGENDH